MDISVIVASEIAHLSQRRMGMTEDEVFKIFDEAGGVITNSHVELSGGKHTTGYIDKSAVYKNTEKVSLLCHAIAERFVNDDVDVVIGPARGGIPLSRQTAHHLRKLTARQILSVHADKSEDGKGFIIRSTYSRLITGKRVLVVKDVLTTGRSTQLVVRAVGSVGGRVIGVGALCNRGDVTARDLGVSKLETLMNVTFHTWDKKDCPRCKEGIPLVEMP